MTAIAAVAGGTEQLGDRLPPIAPGICYRPIRADNGVVRLGCFAERCKIA